VVRRELYQLDTYTLEDLLPPNVPKPGIQVLDSGCNVFKLRLVCAVNLVCLANDEIKLKFDSSVVFGGGQP
jgi:hypothetical protein